MPEIQAPSEADVRGYFEQLSNWGRWGDADTLGTLNLVTDEHRRRAAGLARAGRVVSCGRDIDTVEQPDDAGTAPRRLMVSTGQGEFGPGHGSASELISMYPHGFRLTHLDGLSHQFWNGRMYNGRPADLVTSAQGATELDIADLRDGIVVRAVLVDVPAHRGLAWLPPDAAIGPDEIDAILHERAAAVGPGDAVVLRTGYGAKVAAQGHDRIRAVGRAGWHASCLPWLRHHDIALIATDTATDASPSGYPALRNPVHLVGIVAMGLWIVDNCDLEALARICAELGRWEFALVIAPLPFVGATGSPVNPLALF